MPLEKLDVAEGEGSCVGGWGVGVLTRPKEVEERDDDHVSYRPKVMGVRWELLSNFAQTFYYSDRNRLDTLRRRVLFLPSLQHSCNAKIDSLGSVQPWIVFPHGEERLGNAP